MGLLDEFIPDKLKEQDGNNSEANSSTAASTTSSGNLAAMAAMASQTNSSYVNETPSCQHHETIESISNNSDGDVTHSSRCSAIIYITCQFTFTNFLTSIRFKISRIVAS